MQHWWWKFRVMLRSIMIPLIFLQFVRTLILPNPLDVFILFMLFIVFVALLLFWF